MDEMKEFFEGIDKQLKQSEYALHLDNLETQQFFENQIQNKLEVRKAEDREKARLQRIKDISNNTYNPLDKAFQKDNPSTKAFLDGINAQMEAARAIEAALIPKQKSKEIENLEACQEEVRTMLNEVRANRTIAELKDDEEAIAKYNKQIAKLEVRYTDYTEKIKSILSE